jgi:hypothetical protein
VIGLLPFFLLFVVSMFVGLTVQPQPWRAVSENIRWLATE